VNLLGTSINSNAKRNREDILESAVTALCTLTHTKYEFLGLIAKLVKQTKENQQVIDLLVYQKAHGDIRLSSNVYLDSRRDVIHHIKSIT
jgi:hypothetical protein